MAVCHAVSETLGVNSRGRTSDRHGGSSGGSNGSVNTVRVTDRCSYKWPRRMWSSARPVVVRWPRYRLLERRLG